MKATKILFTLLAMCFVFQVACSEQDVSNRVASPQTEKTATKSELEAPHLKIAKLMQIRGTILRSEDSFTLFTDKDYYKVVGQDLSDLVGSNVQITGTLEEKPDVSIITIESVQPIE